MERCIIIVKNCTNIASEHTQKNASLLLQNDTRGDDDRDADDAMSSSRERWSGKPSASPVCDDDGENTYSNELAISMAAVALF